MNVLLTLLLFFGILFNFCFPSAVFAISGTVDINASVPGCGDGVIQSGESCDNSNFNNQTCSTQGFSGGVLSCNSNCTFNTSQCTSGGGGGGGGVYVPPSPPETKVVFSGRAYPKSSVTLLKDAQVAATTIAGADANFQASISGLSAGNYIFGIYSEDNKGFRSSILTFPISVTAGAITKVSGIFIAPTIAVDKSEVKRGDNIAIFGQSAPNSEITIVVSSDEEFFNKINADQNGIYLLNFDTSPLTIEQHFTKSKAAYKGEISSFSKTVNFLVSLKTIPAAPKKCDQADLNCDGRVNLIDFSIAAYWYKRPLSAAFKTIEKERLNGDGKIDLVDFSIMAYYWTG